MVLSSERQVASRALPGDGTSLMPATQELLHPFSVFRTSDMDTLRLAASTRFGASRVEVADTGQFEARASFVELPNIALAFGATSSKILIEHPEADYARLQIALAGSALTTAGGDSVDINEHQACMTTAGQASLMHCDGGHERLTLRVDQRALAKKLAALLGGKPNGKLEFDAALPMDHPQAQSLLRLILFVARELELNSGKLPELLLSELEQSIVVSVLIANRNSFSDRLATQPRDAAPWQVMRAEEYIEANADRTMLIEELAVATGVGARSLFRSFQQSRGYTPMMFAKTVRLKRARALLQDGGPTTTVSATAFKCGFSNLGHFAKDYRSAFGELPSETLLKREPT